MATTQEPVGQETPHASATPPGALNLLDGLSVEGSETAGFCSGGVCHFPAPKAP
ncbi:hypothetical protein [Microbacterium sp. GCS4]|uniref:hypothetical protein n=1 Tax=Microbacterium sp. GCS4 TaxID=1692239 RepID=UPI00190FDB4E|nr:hypothetical protein [Microbacterium sp. GCS4]